MRPLVAMCLVYGACVTPASAGVTQAQLDAVRVDIQPNAAIPLALSFVDDSGASRTLGEAIGGTPAVVVFADYTCSNLCGPIMAFAAGALEKSGLVPGKDFHLVAIGLDPKDGIREAQAMKASRIGSDSPLAEAAALLIGRPDAIRIATAAAGYHYVYDTEHDQFAHPAAAYVVTAEGRVVRVLSGLELNGGDLRLALIEAGQGRVGTLLEQITLRCFGFDAHRGIHTRSIRRLLIIAGAGTVVAVFGGIGFMAFGMRRRAQS